MTHLQHLIRDAVQRDGTFTIRIGKGAPGHMGTVRALQRAGYTCTYVGNESADVQLFTITN